MTASGAGKSCFDWRFAHKIFLMHIVSYEEVVTEKCCSCFTWLLCVWQWFYGISRGAGYSSSHISVTFCCAAKGFFTIYLFSLLLKNNTKTSQETLLKFFFLLYRTYRFNTNIRVKQHRVTNVYHILNTATPNIVRLTSYFYNKLFKRISVWKKT